MSVCISIFQSLSTSTVGALFFLVLKAPFCGLASYPDNKNEEDSSMNENKKTLISSTVIKERLSSAFVLLGDIKIGLVSTTYDILLMIYCLVHVHYVHYVL